MPLVHTAHLGPVLALHVVEDSKGFSRVYFSSGPTLYVAHVSAKTTSMDRLYTLSSYGETIHHIVTCESSIAVSTAYSVYLFRECVDKRTLTEEFRAMKGTDFILQLSWLSPTKLILVRSRGIVEEVIKKDTDDDCASSWTHIHAIQCEDRGVMWSAAVWSRIENSTASLDLAMGSFQGYILLCKTNLQSKESTQYRLCGHRGPVFSIQFGQHGDLLASTGDDRSVRLWQRQDESSPVESFVQVKCFWGHTARVWDVHFASEDEKLQSRALGDSYTLVSVSEDRTCRTWDRFGLVDVRRGHTGKNVRKVSVASVEGVETVFTGGDDAAVKITKLRKRYHAEVSSRRLDFPAQDRGGGNREAVRAVIMRSETDAIITTDFGRILTVDFSSSKPMWKERFFSSSLRYSPNAAALSSDSALLAVGSANGVVTIHHVPFSAITPAAKDDAPVGPLAVDCSDGDDESRVGLIESSREDEDRSFAVCQTILPTFKGLVLGLYFLENELYVADPHGCLHCYASRTDEAEGFQQLEKLSVLQNPYEAVITFVAVSMERVICGDRKGRILTFARPHLSEGDESGASQNEGSKEDTSSEPTSHFRFHKDRVVDIIFSEDKKVIISAGADGSIAGLSSCRGTILWQSQCHERVNTIDRLFQSGGDLFAAGFRSTTFSIWNLTTSVELATVTCGGWRRPHDLRVREGNPTQGHCLLFWKANDLFLHETVLRGGGSRNIEEGASFHGMRANDLCIVDESTFVTVSEDTTARVTRLNSKTGRLLCVQTLRGHASGVHAVAFDPANGLIYSGGGKSELLCWSIATDGTVALLASVQKKSANMSRKAAVRVTTIVHIKNGILLVGKSDGSLCTNRISWDRKRVEAGVNLVNAHSGAVKASAARDDDIFLTGDTAGVVNVWRLRSFDEFEKLHEIDAHSFGVNGICMARSSSGLFATCGDDQSVAFWDLSNGSSQLCSRQLEPHCAAVTSVVCTEDGRSFVSVGADRKIVLWKVDSGLNGTNVSQSSVDHTTVADPSSASLQKNSIAVTGLGIEVLTLEIENQPQ